ncbi:uric acid degradation bifunctional protein TTL-like [Arachis duranensis]|uniref:2-oxo-4-hydroxy-4-carboxy-5-ureidoimidazoline decarboxylase n=1 Tax=Arachis duranensis TaxID=130453 RepID=A0A6P4BBY3_ARADU|nr:uric acid degradation bifunctional protein TTL-like [Arachis duranensis]
MAMTSPFSSLEHVIMVARDIWSRKLNVRSWLEAISGRSCSNEYLETANEATVQELYEWRSMYEEKFRYVFVTFVAGRISKDILAELKTHFNNSHVVELEIASKEKLNKVVDDTLDGAETDSEDDLDAISFGEYDIARNVELDNVTEKDNETLNTQHREDDVHATKRGFDLKKLPWFGDDLSDPLSRHCSEFLTEFFWPGQYEVDEKF